jgi:hypothetical protein
MVSAFSWPATRLTKGDCPVCSEGFGPCINRQAANGWSCDGSTVDYAAGAEVLCRESTRPECWATGVCPGCHVHLCDLHAADPGQHMDRCKEVQP